MIPTDKTVTEPWAVGETVVITSGVRLLDGARGKIIDVGLLGKHPIRVRVAGRRGLSTVTVGAEELRRPGPCKVEGCERTSTYDDLCLPDLVRAVLA